MLALTHYLPGSWGERVQYKLILTNHVLETLLAGYRVAAPGCSGKRFLNSANNSSLSAFRPARRNSSIFSSQRRGG